MRLINTDTFKLEEFIGSAPPYAILSHTWEKDEVTFQDWQLTFNEAKAKRCLSKIGRACARARQDRLDYLWCDTNCIDKTSSAELSEAINSMIMWYRNAVVCYAFLADVPPKVDGADAEAAGELLDSAFAKSRWFTRGWTLQELLAPKRLVFFDSSWAEVGSRTELVEVVARVTGIQERYLLPSSDARRKALGQASVAERMSWVASRETTRVEDMAYCMLGILDINMPLLYGEGQKAFVRLQEEFLRVSNDQTIFCWKWDEKHVPRDWVSMLSPSPKTYAESAQYVESVQRYDWAPFAMANAGLSIRLPVIEANSRVLAVLDVRRMSGEETSSVALPLAGPFGRALYMRCHFPPVPIPVATRDKTEERDLYVIARRRNTVPTPLRSCLRRDEAAGFQILLVSHSPNMEMEILCSFAEPKSLPWGYPLNILRLSPLEQSDRHFGGICWVSLRRYFHYGPVYVNFPVIFGVVLLPSGPVWVREVWGISTASARIAGDPYPDYADFCDKNKYGMARNIDQLAKRPESAVSTVLDRDNHITLSVFLGSPFSINDRSKIALAQIHLSQTPKQIAGIRPRQRGNTPT